MESTKQNKPAVGMVVLFGSGETAPSGRKAYDLVLSRLPEPPKIALLETPAGFELNSAQVIGRVGEFIEKRLQNYAPQVEVVPARRRGTEFSPDDPQITAPLLNADMVFMGPGSPTYAVRQLKESRAWYNLTARHRLGGALVLASAAAIAISSYALPVYEIYKVGEDLHWKQGLDFFGAYGLPLVFIPHWNNNDGGEELDTSRCFMGQERFAQLVEMLPPELTVIGIDEMTALVMDIQADEAQVVGAGGVTLIHTGHGHDSEEKLPDLKGTGLAEIAGQRQGHVHQYQHGEHFALSICCPLEMPELASGLPDDVWQAALQAQREKELEKEMSPQEQVSEDVRQLVAERQAARAAKDWKRADELREELASQGWQVQDTPEGPHLEPLEK